MNKRIRAKAVRRRSCVGGGGAPVNFGRRRRAADPKNRRWRPNLFSKIPEQISFYPKHFLRTFFSNQKLQQNKYTATMASAARRQIIGGGAPINKNRGPPGPQNFRGGRG